MSQMPQVSYGKIWEKRDAIHICEKSDLSGNDGRRSFDRRSSNLSRLFTICEVTSYGSIESSMRCIYPTFLGQDKQKILQVARIVSDRRSKLHGSLPVFEAILIWSF